MQVKTGRAFGGVGGHDGCGVQLADVDVHDVIENWL
jgi:hypothetical protein